MIAGCGRSWRVVLLELLCPMSTPTPIASSSVAMPAMRLNPAEVRDRRGGDAELVVTTFSTGSSCGSASAKRGLPRRSPQMTQ